MGRTVQDVALMLQAIAGYDSRAPISWANRRPSSLKIWGATSTA